MPILRKQSSKREISPVQKPQKPIKPYSVDIQKKKEYKTKRVIGIGTYGIVREAVHIPTGRTVALKIIKKNVIKEHHKEGMVERELNILKKIKHPHIVEFIDYFETKSKYYIVFELATGGELFDRICQKRKFTEKDAAIVITTVVGAVSFLHARGIVHRDIKPENLLYRNNSPNSDLLLCDFGISKMIESPEEMLTTVCGSPGYTAPEILKHKPYSKPVDMWSIGVITYTLLCGYSPFHYADDINQLYNAICHGRYTFDNIYWAYISRYAKDFIKSLLQVQPEKRLTADEALQHTWLVKLCPAQIERIKNINGVPLASNSTLKRPIKSYSTSATQGTAHTDPIKASNSRVKPYVKSKYLITDETNIPYDILHQNSYISFNNTQTSQDSDNDKDEQSYPGTKSLQNHNTVDVSNYMNINSHSTLVNKLSNLSDISSTSGATATSTATINTVTIPIGQSANISDNNNNSTIENNDSLKVINNINHSNSLIVQSKPSKDQYLSPVSKYSNVSDTLSTIVTSNSVASNTSATPSLYSDSSTVISYVGNNNTSTSNKSNSELNEEKNDTLLQTSSKLNSEIKEEKNDVSSQISPILKPEVKEEKNIASSQVSPILKPVIKEEKSDVLSFQISPKLNSVIKEEKKDISIQISTNLINTDSNKNDNLSFVMIDSPNSPSSVSSNLTKCSSPDLSKSKKTSYDNSPIRKQSSNRGEGLFNHIFKKKSQSNIHLSQNVNKNNSVKSQDINESGDLIPPPRKDSKNQTINKHTWKTLLKSTSQGSKLFRRSKENLKSGSLTSKPSTQNAFNNGNDTFSEFSLLSYAISFGYTNFASEITRRSSSKTTQNKMEENTYKKAAAKPKKYTRKSFSTSATSSLSSPIKTYPDNELSSNILTTPNFEKNFNTFESNDKLEKIIDKPINDHDDKLEKNIDKSKSIHDDKLEKMMDKSKSIHDNKLEENIDKSKSVHVDKLEKMVDKSKSVHDDKLEKIIEETKNEHNNEIEKNIEESKNNRSKNEKTRSNENLQKSQSQPSLSEEKNKSKEKINKNKNKNKGKAPDHPPWNDISDDESYDYIDEMDIIYSMKVENELMKKKNKKKNVRSRSKIIFSSSKGWYPEEPVVSLVKENGEIKGYYTPGEKYTFEDRTNIGTRMNHNNISNYDMKSLNGKGSIPNPSKRPIPSIILTERTETNSSTSSLIPSLNRIKDFSKKTQVVREDELNTDISDDDDYDDLDIPLIKNKDYKSNPLSSTPLDNIVIGPKELEKIDIQEDVDIKFETKQEEAFKESLPSVSSSSAVKSSSSPAEGIRYRSTIKRVLKKEESYDFIDEFLTDPVLRPPLPITSSNPININMDKSKDNHNHPSSPCIIVQPPSTVTPAPTVSYTTAVATISNDNSSRDGMETSLSSTKAPPYNTVDYDYSKSSSSSTSFTVLSLPKASNTTNTRKLCSIGRRGAYYDYKNDHNRLSVSTISQSFSSISSGSYSSTTSSPLLSTFNYQSFNNISNTNIPQVSLLTTNTSTKSSIKASTNTTTNINTNINTNTNINRNITTTTTATTTFINNNNNNNNDNNVSGNNGVFVSNNNSITRRSAINELIMGTKMYVEPEQISTSMSSSGEEDFEEDIYQYKFGPSYSLDENNFEDDDPIDDSQNIPILTDESYIANFSANGIKPQIPSFEEEEEEEEELELELEKDNKNKDNIDFKGKRARAKSDSRCIDDKRIGINRIDKEETDGMLHPDAYDSSGHKRINSTSACINFDKKLKEENSYIDDLEMPNLLSQDLYSKVLRKRFQRAVRILYIVRRLSSKSSVSSSSYSYNNSNDISESSNKNSINKIDPRKNSLSLGNHSRNTSISSTLSNVVTPTSNSEVLVLTPSSKENLSPTVRPVNTLMKPKVLNIPISPALSECQIFNKEEKERCQENDFKVKNNEIKEKLEVVKREEEEEEKEEKKTNEKHEAIKEEEKNKEKVETVKVEEEKNKEKVETVKGEEEKNKEKVETVKVEEEKKDKLEMIKVEEEKREKLETVKVKEEFKEKVVVQDKSKKS